MLKKYLVFPLILLVSLVLFVIPSKIESKNKGVDIAKAVVLEIREQAKDVQDIRVRFESGELKGSEILINNDESLAANPRLFEVGDEVMVATAEGEIFYIQDYYRSPALFWIFIVFVILVALVAKGQGMSSIFAMAFSFVVLFKLVLPQIFAGMSPVLAVLFGALLIIPATFYSSHGFSRKTSIAVVSTIVTLILTGLLAMGFADFAKLTGLASEEVSYLNLNLAQSIDFSGLLLAGMIISILGILDDITVSQASVVRELKLANSRMSFFELYKSAMKVGRDHISSLVNTLILVYTGASLPLLLVFLDYNESFLTIVNYEFMSEEIVRTLVGSVGLVLAVPITTVLASFVFAKKKPADLAKEGGKGHCH